MCNLIKSGKKTYYTFISVFTVFCSILCGAFLFSETIEFTAAVGAEAKPFLCFTLENAVTGDFDYAKSFRLKSVLGSQPVLLSFFTRTCAACKDEIAALHTIYDTYKKQGIPFYLILVRVDGETDAEVLNDAKAREYRIPVLYHKYPSSVFQSYLTDAQKKPLPFPVMYIIDRFGIIRYAHVGFNKKAAKDALEPAIHILDSLR